MTMTTSGSGLSTPRGATVVNAAEANAPGWAETLTPSTSSTPPSLHQTGAIKTTQVVWSLDTAVKPSSHDTRRSGSERPWERA